MSPFGKQQHFMEVFNLKKSVTPQFDAMMALLWSKLMMEEMTEFEEAFDQFADNPKDEVAIANVTAEIADVVYVLMGFAHSQGLPLEQMFNAIHDANMRKSVNGQVIRNEFGKVLKPAGWTPADKVAVIRKAMETEVHGS